MKRAEFCFSFLRKSGISYALLSDITKGQRVDFLKPADYFGSNPILKAKRKFNNIFFNKVHVCFRKYKNKIVFMTNETISCLSEKDLLKIRSLAKKIVLFFIDEFFNDYESMRKAKEYFFNHRDLFDLVYTFSQKDAKEYNMLHTLSYYHKKDYQKVENKSDLFFIGNVKDRKQTLLTIYEKLSKENVNCKFIISAEPNDIFPNGFIRGATSYDKVIDEVISANCILDLPDYRQEGMTLRYFEAVVYNKKLLTTNKNVKNMPYYNERFMRIIESAKELNEEDAKWLKQEDDVCYNYKGEYEPSRFLSQILSDLR